MGRVFDECGSCREAFKRMYICVRAMTVAYQRSLLLQRFSQHVLNTLLEYCNAPQKAIFV